MSPVDQLLKLRDQSVLLSNFYTDEAQNAVYRGRVSALDDAIKVLRGELVVK